MAAYQHLRGLLQDGCLPNVVTYNTLIDVYGKMGQWEQAIKVLTLMKGEVRLSWRALPVAFRKAY